MNVFSEGLIYVQEDTRLIFIEGKDDVDFYNKTYETLITKHNLSNTPSLKFIPASIRSPESGGCTEVKKMVERFDGSVIEKLVHGIIDRDAGNAASKNIQVLKRYSIENYLYDPLVMAVTLVRTGKHRAKLTTLNDIDTNDVEALLSDTNLLQHAIDEIISIIKSQTGWDTSQETPVTTSVVTKYNENQAIEYVLPKWFFDISKKSLTTETMFKVGSTLRGFTAEDQYLSLEAGGIVYQDLYDIFGVIQR